MLQNNLFKKKDAINITPFLDIMLVLFVVIIVAASFKEDANKSKEKELFLKISFLEKQLDNLKKENIELLKENSFLKKQVLQKEIFVNKSKEILSKCVLDVNVMDNYLEVGGNKYSAEQFLSLARSGLIKNANFYIKKTNAAEAFYEDLKEKLKKIGFTFKN